MFETENRMPIDVSDRSRINNRLIAASMLLTASISYALVVLQPGLVGTVDGLWTLTAALAKPIDQLALLSGEIGSFALVFLQRIDHLAPVSLPLGVDCVAHSDAFFQESDKLRAGADAHHQALSLRRAFV